MWTVRPLPQPLGDELLKCPTCTTTALVMTDRSGIEIDYCPDCRGVWLDRGELDKIIERAAPNPQPAPSPSRYPVDAMAVPERSIHRDRDRDRKRDDDDSDHFDDDDHRRQQPAYTDEGRPSVKRRKKGLLADLFDF